jgi:hypothetical protein
VKAKWLLPLPLGFLLASPLPPSLLSYNLVSLGDGARLCADLPSTKCDTAAALVAQFTPPAPPAPPPPIIVAVPPDRGIRMVVSLPQQRLYVFRNGELLTTSEVSTGKRGHGTPTGTFRILQKAVFHRSNLYSSAPMPYMQRLTEGGVALHAGHVPGYPASHGCIRLPLAMAKKLYTLTNFSTTAVTVTRSKPRDADAAFQLLAPIMVLQKVRPPTLTASRVVPVAAQAQSQPKPAAKTTIS